MDVEMTPERIELIVKACREYKGMGIGTSFLGSCGFDNSFDNLACILSEETGLDITYEEIAHICEEIDGVVECQTCGWYADREDMDEDMNCSDCVEEMKEDMEGWDGEDE